MCASERERDSLHKVVTIRVIVHMRLTREREMQKLKKNVPKMFQNRIYQNLSLFISIALGSSPSLKVGNLLYCILSRLESQQE